MPVASASPMSGETKSYTLKVTEAYSIDLGDSGTSHGDIAVRNGVIKSASGKKLGTFTSIQIIVGKDSDKATEDRQSSMQFNFAGGSLMTTGTIRAPQGGGLVTDHEFALVGGTGKFAGAMGTMKVSPLKAPSFKATFSFM
jgi:hypothetical protein